MSHKSRQKTEQKTGGIPAGLLHIAETIPSRAVAKIIRNAITVKRKPASYESVDHEREDDRLGTRTRREVEGRDAASPFVFNHLDVAAKSGSGDVEAQPRLERAEDQVCHAGKLRPGSCRFQAIGLRGGAYRSVNEMRLFLHSRCYPCQIC